MSIAVIGDACQNRLHLLRGESLELPSVSGNPIHDPRDVAGHAAFGDELVKDLR